MKLPPPVCRKGNAVWAEHYTSTEEMADAADAIIVGEVESLGPGKSVANLPFTRVRLSVEEVVKGDAGLKNGFTLRQTGGGNFIVHDDPPYVVGERYTLYLRQFRTESGLYRPISPHCRYCSRCGRSGGFWGCHRVR